MKNKSPREQKKPANIDGGVTQGIMRFPRVLFWRLIVVRRPSHLALQICSPWWQQVHLPGHYFMSMDLSILTWNINGVASGRGWRYMREMVSSTSQLS